MSSLSQYTSARVSLGSAGGSLPTKPLLDLRLAHARARDAVYWPFDPAALQHEFATRGWPSTVLTSAAGDRDEYLRRPDLGRVLDPRHRLEPRRPSEIIFIVADGLSALAVERHAVPVLDRVFTMLPHFPAPILIVKNARVAIGDWIGSAWKASISVLLIGERPGLSSPDSLGVYLTWNPRPGCSDAQRNCISNIHGSGLPYETAAFKTVFLIREMLRLKLSGVGLKDTSSGSPTLR